MAWWQARIIFFYVMLAMLAASIFFPMLILHWTSYRMRYKVVYFYSWGFIMLAKYICKMDYEVEGLENIPEGPAVVLANHQSFWDNFIPVLLFPIQSWVIKRELFDIPLFGLGLKIADPIAIDRTKNSSINQILDEGTKKLKQGLWIVMFPEGTRIRPGQTVPFKASGAKLAHINGVPIVPMAHNAGLLWPKGFWFDRPGMVKIKIGAPIYPREGQDVRELNNQVETWINATKAELEKLG